ncbi:BON domain-containing protein [Limnoglobus roseus]|uniref:BON domain-containing protein n=1 Tax=Limnoglobus roseus TaxID=2598579 RepID=A0A5C1ABR3_9BACT|nr:BON domain-containing protein [Limnoglobus roseus]QEL16025.1 BON domain-containing protein [Limnoglobus roseus]
MNVRSLFLSAVVAGGGLGTAAAAEPAKLPQPITQAAPTPANQKLADGIATQLTTTGSAQNADVSLSVTDGVVTVTGTAKDQATHDKVIDDVRRVAGVKKVRDGLSVQPASAVTQAQAVGPVVGGGLAAVPPSPHGGMGGAPLVEPTPLGMAGPGMAGADLQAPPLPPYAWPTYAPHNNLSRVAYPQAYPHNAFPFIGPYYPFPKVPPGWRKVVLEWDDGHWWLGRLQTPHDYWRVRFQ